MEFTKETKAQVTKEATRKNWQPRKPHKFDKYSVDSTSLVFEWEWMTLFVEPTGEWQVTSNAVSPDNNWTGHAEKWNDLPTVAEADEEMDERLTKEMYDEE